MSRFHPDQQLGSRRTSRRTFLSALGLMPGLAAASVRQVYPPEVYQYLDPTTEEVVVRLTEPTAQSMLPGYPGRAISRRRNFLIYLNDRSGSWQVYRMDLKDFQSTQLTEATALDTRSVTLLGGDQEFCYWDGDKVVAAGVGSGRSRPLCEARQDSSHGSPLAASPDGTALAFVENEGARFRIQECNLRRGGVRTLATLPFAVDRLAYHRDLTILCREGQQALWLIDRSGKPRKLTTAPGAIRAAIWGPEGRTVFYLSEGTQPGEVPAVRTLDVATGADKLVGKTSRFADFSSNGDASVFVGASASKASPHVILMLRSTRREFVLCEHRASNPEMVAPVFSPRSQLVFFHTDRDGKRAIYMVDVERLVAETES